MSVIKINVLSVPEGRGEVLEQRFASRAGEVETVDGFESFELLRPTEGTDRYLVITRWRDDDAFQAWLNSAAFTKGHARSAADAESGDQDHGEGTSSHGAGSSEGSESEGGHPHGQGSGPAATGSELWGYEVVTSATAAS